MEPTSLAVLQGAAGAKKESTYVDDVFSTYLYKGTSSTQSINNGIDLSGEGGLTWIKIRGSTNDHHLLYDTERGATKQLISNLGNGQSTESRFSSFNSNGFTITTNDNEINNTSYDYVSWTFRKSPGFFDVVTYTSQDGVTAINHSLGSVPGCIMIKKLNGGTSWQVYHRHIGATKRLELEGDGVAQTNGAFANTTPTATQFYINQGSNDTFGNIGDQFVAFLWAHDSATYGENEDQSIIKCGGYNGNGSSSGTEIDLGFEPQWIFLKVYEGESGNWYQYDTMRGWDATYDENQNHLLLNTNSAEGDVSNSGKLNMSPTQTGFRLNNADFNKSGKKYIYMAIRRPFKPPAAGTDVFNAVTRSGVNATTAISSGNSRVTDMVFTKNRGTGNANVIGTRLQRRGAWSTNSSDGDNESFWTTRLFWDNQYGVRYAQYDQVNQSGSNYIDHFFTRAPGVFDVVSYIGTGSNRTVTHNLGVTPEMMWIKKRDTTSGGDNWQIYHSSQGNGKYSFFGTDPFYTSGARWNNTSPTSTQFTVATDSDVNASGHKFIAMLFATKEGISKVGSYSGTGSAQNIDCGFDAGARYVMIKRADVEAQNPAADRTNWYVWDSARGIVSGNDPWTALNMSSADDTSTDYIDPLNAGFTVSGTGGAVNASGGTYIFLAFA